MKPPCVEEVVKTRYEERAKFPLIKDPGFEHLQKYSNKTVFPDFRVRMI